MTLIICPCSTVDQFSGESAPVVLPLDDKQVTLVHSYHESDMISISGFS